MTFKDIVEITGFFVACLLLTSLAMTAIAMAMTAIVDIAAAIVNRRRGRKIFRDR